MKEDDVIDFLEIVVELADDSEGRDRRKAIATTVTRLRAGEPVTGGPTLSYLVADPKLPDRLADWLGLSRPTRSQSMKGRLIGYGRENDLFHDGAGASFVTVAMNGHRETYPVKSEAFNAYLDARYYRETGEGVSPQVQTRPSTAPRNRR